MKTGKILWVLFIPFLSTAALATNTGLITRMGFSGSNSIWGTNHSDIVQIRIEGGFSAENCDPIHAAIKKSDEHLVSAALAAFISGKTISVQLNDSETYYDGTRCIIRDIFIEQ